MVNSGIEGVPGPRTSPPHRLWLGDYHDEPLCVLISHDGASIRGKSLVGEFLCEDHCSSQWPGYLSTCNSWSQSQVRSSHLKHSWTYCARLVLPVSAGQNLTASPASVLSLFPVCPAASLLGNHHIVLIFHHYTAYKSQPLGLSLFLPHSAAHNSCFVDYIYVLPLPWTFRYRTLQFHFKYPHSEIHSDHISLVSSLTSTSRLSHTGKFLLSGAFINYGSKCWIL